MNTEGTEIFSMLSVSISVTSVLKNNVNVPLSPDRRLDLYPWWLISLDTCLPRSWIHLWFCPTNRRVFRQMDISLAAKVRVQIRHEVQPFQTQTLILQPGAPEQHQHFGPIQSERQNTIRKYRSMVYLNKNMRTRTNALKEKYGARPKQQYL